MFWRDEEFRESLRELMRYMAASGAALGVDFGVLALLVDRAGWQYLLAATASFIAGGVFLYAVSVKLVFRFRRIERVELELPTFLALGVIGLLVNLTVVWASVERLHVHYLVAKGGASVCTFALNFALRRNIMFSRHTEAAK